jgi:hypothetical protein
MKDWNEMTEEEADKLDEYYTTHTIMSQRGKPGLMAKRAAANRFAGLDDFSINYLITRSTVTHRTPEEVIGELIREKVGAAAAM